MSDCPHRDEIYSYCLACELAKREKLVIALETSLAEAKEMINTLRNDLRLTQDAHIEALGERDSAHEMIQKSICKECEGSCGNHALNCPNNFTGLREMCGKLAEALGIVRKCSNDPGVVEAAEEGIRAMRPEGGEKDGPNK